MDFIIQIIGQIIGCCIFVLFVYLLVKRAGKKWEDTFTLEEDEKIVELRDANYCKNEILISSKPIPGKLAFTNKRLIFKETSLLPTLDDISIPYNEILEIKKTFYVTFFPMGMTIVMKDNSSHKFGILKRNRYIDLINSLAKGEVQE